MAEYEALWYNEWSDPPAYVMVDFIEGKTPEQALLNNLQSLMDTVREVCFLPDDPSDEKIQETLYILRNNALVSLYSIQKKKRKKQAPLKKA